MRASGMQMMLAKGSPDDVDDADDADDAGDGHTPAAQEMIDFLVDELAAFTTRARQRESLNDIGDPHWLIKSIVQMERTIAEEEPIEDTDGVWTHLSSIQHLLARLIREPFETLEENLRLHSPRRPSQLEGAKATYYIREFRFDSIEQLEEHLCAYAVFLPCRPCVGALPLELDLDCKARCAHRRRWRFAHFSEGELESTR